jgi:hypothetical protein
VLVDEALQLADEVRVAAEREVCVDSFFERAYAQLLQSRDLRLGERLVRELVQWRPPPQAECLAQHRGCLYVSSRRELSPGVLEQQLEPARVDRLGVDPEQVAGGTRDDQVVAERAA